MNSYKITIVGFLAILFARGAYEAKNLKRSYLWSAKCDLAFFAQTISKDKFIDILRFICFYKKNERSERLKIDKFVLISKIWEKFTENSQACYKPDANITTDEQLFPIKADTNLHSTFRICQINSA